MPSAQAVVAEDTRPVMLGGDPEVFVKNRITGRVVPACGQIGGKKGTGVPVNAKKDSRHLRVLEDNVTVELNFNPVIDHYHWSDNMTYLNHDLEVFLGKKGLTSHPTSSHHFTEAELAIPGAHVFGCEPDFDAYDPTDRRRVVSPSAMGNNRFCGGHLHLGYNNPNKIEASGVAILCDMFLGLPSVSYDSQGERRKWYGQAGLYRPKPYGMEYRTMSNWWLRPEHVSASTNMCREAFQVMYVVDGYLEGLYTLFEKMPLKDIKLVIDSENPKLAREVWLQARAYANEAGLPLGACFIPRVV